MKYRIVCIALMPEVEIVGTIEGNTFNELLMRLPEVDLTEKTLYITSWTQPNGDAIRGLYLSLYGIRSLLEHHAAVNN